jgi:hypothetical protein
MGGAPTGWFEEEDWLNLLYVIVQLKSSLNKIGVTT